MAFHNVWQLGRIAQCLDTRPFCERVTTLLSACAHETVRRGPTIVRRVFLRSQLFFYCTPRGIFRYAPFSTVYPAYIRLPALRHSASLPAYCACEDNKLITDKHCAVAPHTYMYIHTSTCRRTSENGAARRARAKNANACRRHCE